VVEERISFSAENRARFERLVARYPVKRSALLPALHLLQEQEGFISLNGMEYLAGLLELTPAQVHDTASFYTMFRFAPSGRRQVEVCTNLSCALKGADAWFEHACRQRDADRPGGDGVALQRVECLAACGGGPAVQVDGRWVENATVGDVAAVLSGRLTARPFDWPKSPGEPVLLRNVHKQASTAIETYRAGGGYGRLKQNLETPPEQIIDTIKRSNLRGRGGAGFPTGLKWSFLPKDSAKPRYLCVNADEGEPGTFKDRLLIERDPHQLIEGCIVSAHAIRSQRCFIYIRGEFHEGVATLERALEEARSAGFVGSNILGTGVDVEIVVHRGAGSYECGEETALIESLEGKRGQPRLKPPFPATQGLYGCPTIVNNVETLVCVPLILERGPEWFAAYGTEKNGGPKLYCVSGHVARPGVYEAPMGRITLRDLILGEGYGAGIPGGRRLKAVVPGGSSTPVLTASEIDVALDFDSLAKAGSMLGSAGTIVMDDSTCMVWMAERLMHFYKDESCGKCTPCREGTGVLLRLLTRIEAGQGSAGDLDHLTSICVAIAGKTLCPFGDAAIAPPQSTLAKFRAEFEYHVREKRCWKSVAATFEESVR
jgi:NADH-quinone oxidoreductase subunit F